MVILVLGAAFLAAYVLKTRWYVAVVIALLATLIQWPSTEIEQGAGWMLNLTSALLMHWIAGLILRRRLAQNLTP